MNGDEHEHLSSQTYFLDKPRLIQRMNFIKICDREIVYDIHKKNMSLRNCLWHIIVKIIIHFNKFVYSILDAMVGRYLSVPVFHTEKVPII